MFTPIPRLIALTLLAGALGACSAPYTGAPTVPGVPTVPSSSSAPFAADPGVTAPAPAAPNAKPTPTGAKALPAGPAKAAVMDKAGAAGSASAAIAAAKALLADKVKAKDTFSFKAMTRGVKGAPLTGRLEWRIAATANNSGFLVTVPASGVAVHRTANAAEEFYIAAYAEGIAKAGYDSADALARAKEAGVTAPTALSLVSGAEAKDTLGKAHANPVWLVEAPGGTLCIDAVTGATL